MCCFLYFVCFHVILTQFFYFHMWFFFNFNSFIFTWKLFSTISLIFACCFYTSFNFKCYFLQDLFFFFTCDFSHLIYFYRIFYTMNSFSINFYKIHLFTWFLHDSFIFRWLLHGTFSHVIFFHNSFIFTWFFSQFKLTLQD